MRTGAALHCRKAVFCCEALARRSFGALREHRRWSSARTHRISQAGDLPGWALASPTSPEAIDLWVDARHQSRVRRALGVWRQLLRISAWFHIFFSPPSGCVEPRGRFVVAARASHPPPPCPLDQLPGATALSAFLTATRTTAKLVDRKAPKAGTHASGASLCPVPGLRRWLNGWSSLARREQRWLCQVFVAP